MDITEITFRIPTGRDIRAMGSEGSGVEADHKLMNLTERPNRANGPI
jgi:hypothetical protein